MPELPEVETVRATLEKSVVGKRVSIMQIKRKDVVRGAASGWKGAGVSQVIRHGKQLAVVTERGGVACIHLGMSGRLCVYDRDKERNFPPHTHVVWRFEDGSALAFTDPRRFGGVWCFENEEVLRAQRWSRLGDDALLITPGRLHAALLGTRRGLKAALLDQAVVAGLGNIYVDELLFGVGLPPDVTSADLAMRDVKRLVPAMRRLLNRAITAGGSTLRDYVDANGSPGRFALRHKVYGRGGQPCSRCKATLRAELLAGRTTVWCDRCQKF